MRAKLKIIQDEAKFMLKKHATEKPGRTNRNITEKEKSSSTLSNCLGEVGPGKEYAVPEGGYAFSG